MGSETGDHSPIPDLLNSCDPFLGFSDPSPDDNGSIRTPADIVELFQQSDSVSGSMLPSASAPTSVFNLDDFEMSPEGLRIVQVMQSTSWLDDFLV